MMAEPSMIGKLFELNAETGRYELAIPAIPFIPAIPKISVADADDSAIR